MTVFRLVCHFVFVLALLGSLALPSEARHRHRHHRAPVVVAAVAVAIVNPVKDKKPPVPGDLQTTYLGDMKVSYWDPITNGEMPLIFFSHSFGGCSAQSSFMMAEFAKHGWLVMAPNHADAKCSQNFKSEKALPVASWWNDKLFLSRRDDIKRLYRNLRYEPVWKNRIDWSRVAVMGNGLGGYTALALAGGHASWKMDGLAGVIALRPACAPLVMNGQLDNIAAPVVYFTGARDDENTTPVKQQQGCFDKTLSNVTYVEFDKAGSSAFTDTTATGHAKMTGYAVEFLTAAFAGKPWHGTKTAGIVELKQK
jgi:predicted dienelactone hydrolase